MHTGDALQRTAPHGNAFTPHASPCALRCIAAPHPRCERAFTAYTLPWWQIFTPPAGVGQCVGIQRREHDGSVQPGDLFRPNTAACAVQRRPGPAPSSRRRPCPQHPDPPGGHLPHSGRDGVRRIHLLRTMFHRGRGRVRTSSGFAIFSQNRLPWQRPLRYRKKSSRSIICTQNAFIQ